ncbi:hypothetical protein Msub_13208 [Marinobacter subterrani]|uniref:Uncharacterized protein n=1 Tax=Marinobacter subterrani TaxID=1658765 RepID=A0A0J7J707_9GAMM|nr:hypothetical protein Msub_20985 [Marinobacter subterrani]KMQ75353.1 hypothetical protein Msub_11555 [Marinobacter subterrani]KMQ76993.1 hypothetical protein Msub_13208 [Marinobacter subterrani]
MPDMERLTDELRVHLAKTPEDKAYARGFNAGKYFARKQAAWCVVFGAVVAVVISVHAWH